MWLLRLGYKRHYSFFLGLSLDHFLKVTSADPSLLSGKELRPPASSFVSHHLGSGFPQPQSSLEMIAVPADILTETL